MIDRLILSAMLGTAGWHGLYPDPTPPTTASLQAKAKQKSVSAVCEKKKKQSQAVKKLCTNWEKHT